MKYLDDTGLGYFWNKIKNKMAASGGTDLSLVTTGEKYTWNNKSNLTLGTTSTTALKGDTKYAGSSSAGGAATSANKLNTDAGSMLNPVHFSSGVPVASSGNTIPYIVGTGTTAGTWLGTLEGLTAYYDGLLILYKPSVAGASTTTLNLNSLGAKTCYVNSGTKLTTHFPAQQPILLVYASDRNSGCWVCLDDYWTDSNTYTTAWCGTNGNTAAKAASCTNFTLHTHTYIPVLMRYANSIYAPLTLNINGTGAKPIYINGMQTSSSNNTLPAGMYFVYYNGTNYYFRTDAKLTASITGDAKTVDGHSIDTSIGNGSTSTNLPTSQAVANFVEGKGYGTSNLALGETSSTAYRGDRGAEAYTHATDSSRLTTATASGLYKVGSTAEGHIASLTSVIKSDITSLGIPAQDTTYESKDAASGGTDVSLVTTGEKYNWNRLTTDLLNKLTYIGTSTAVSGTYTTAVWSAGTATDCTWTAPRDGKYIVYAYFKNHDDNNNQGKVYKQFQLRGTATKEVANPILYQAGTGSTSSTDSANATIMGVQGSTFVTATTGQTVVPYIHTPVANIVWEVKIVGVYIG